jgi:hemerythrin-like domain-containing protein
MMALRLMRPAILRNSASPAALSRGAATQLTDLFESEWKMAKAQGKASAHAEDAAKLLVEDHRKVQRIFDKFKKLKSGDVEKKQDLVRTACTELRIHAMLEEEIFYPAVREKLDETGLIDEAEVEHAVAKQLIGELEEMTPEEEMYDAKFTVLGEYVNHHVAEEEKEIIPQAKKAKVDMQALGKEIQQRRQELRQQAGVLSDEQS